MVCFTIYDERTPNEIPRAAADVKNFLLPFLTFPLFHVSKHLGWRHRRTFLTKIMTTCSKQQRDISQSLPVKEFHLETKQQ